METSTQSKQVQSEIFYVEPKIFLSGDYLIHVLPGNMLTRRHVHYYLRVLGQDFSPKGNLSAG